MVGKLGWHCLISMQVEIGGMLRLKEKMLFLPLTFGREMVTLL
jgi:hypothetical protein